MKAYIFLFSGLFCLLFTFHWYTKIFAFPNHTVISLSASGKTEEQIRTLLAQQEKNKIQIKVKERVYPYTYKSLGIAIDKDTTIQKIFLDNHKSFPQNYIVFFRSFFVKQAVYPSLIFSQDFSDKVKTLAFDFSPESDAYVVDSATKTITFNEQKELYRINQATLKQHLLLTFGEKDVVLSPSLIRVDKNDKQFDIESINKKMQTITQRPVTLAIDDKNTIKTLVFSPSDLRSILGVKTKRENSVDIDVNEKAIEQILKDRKTLIKTDENDIDTAKISQDLLSLFTSRFNGETAETILAKVSYRPNTSGDKAEKYIEIDITQQQMYLWEKGKNISRYVVSTGLYYPTPTGVFKIMNKAKNAYSDIYNVWMPYWMAIYLDPKINAYIGIHELPYWVSGNGDQIRRPRDFLGSPHTGGCISLDVGIAQKVQDWSDIGTPVYIFN